MTGLENILSQEIIQRLGWTLLHFVWQATVAALLVAVLLAVMRKSSSNVRYTIACLALGLIVVLPVVTIQLVPVSVFEPPASVQPMPAPVVLPVVQVREMPAVEAPVVEPPVQVENAGPAPVIPWRQRATERIEPVLPYVVSGWLIGVFALSVWHLGGWTQLQRLRRKMVKPVDASLLAKLDDLAEKLGVRRAVQLTESALVQIPTVVGWLRPVILLPASALTGLTTGQLDAILAHELAHIRRYDYLVNMLQTIVETLGFYHPAVWWISHKIRVERENCCDDLAIVVTGDRVRYARALTSMEEIRGRNSELAVTAAGGNLFSRIRRLIGKDSAEKTFSWIPAVTVILLLVALIISTTLALATNEKNPSAELIANKSENEPLNAEKSDSSTKVLIETQIIHVNNEFLQRVGLDADSLKISNSWTQYRVDDSSNPSMFVIDSHKRETLQKIVDESQGSSSISRIFLMAMSGQEATIKNGTGYEFKSQELGRFIKIKPELSQDGQNTYIDCELLIRQFENFKLFSDVYINKKVDRNDVSESEIVESQVNAENALLSVDHTLLILGGKLVSFRDVEDGKPILRSIPVTGEFFDTTSNIEGQKNEIILIKTSIVPPERSDDVDSKASSYNVAKIGGYKTSELLRIYLDLHLEAGQYVEIKDRGQREPKFKQVNSGDIGKSAKDWPAYASYIEFEIRSNFDLNLATKRYTRGSFFEHDKWDAYFTGPDTIISNGYFSPTTLCVSLWRAKLYASGLEDVVIIPSLLAVIIKPSNKPQASSAEVQKGDGLKVNAEGQQILKLMAKTNRYWLIGPPAEVRNYSYDFNLHLLRLAKRLPERAMGPETVEVENPASAERRIVQGVTYSSVLQKLAIKPSAATITNVDHDKAKGRIRLDFTLSEPVRVECGNGISRLHLGYFGMNVSSGSLWLDAKNKVPIELRAGDLTERFSEYVEAGISQYVPLRIGFHRYKTEDTGQDCSMHFDFKFGLFGSGLWLFDQSSYRLGEFDLPLIDKPLVGYTTNIKINGTPRQKTDIDVKSSKAAARSDLQELDQRSQSTHDLYSLRGYLKLYTRDHDGKYPVGLEALGEFAEEFPWILENVKYLGKGKTVAESSDTIIAYDRELLDKVGGANVLLDDSRILFLGREQLDEKLQKSSSDLKVEENRKQLNDILEKLSDRTPADKSEGVCESVENYIAAALAGEDGIAAEYAYPNTAVVAQTEDTREALQGQNIRILSLCLGQWNALAISSVIQADQGRIGPAIFHLKKVILEQETHWLIDDIDLETLDSIEGEIKRFLERNPEAKTTTFKPQRPLIEPGRDDGERTEDTQNRKNLHDFTMEAALAIESENYRLAQIFAERAVQSKPDSADGWLFLGMASIKMNDYDRARQSYERALALYRDADDIGQQEFVLRLLGRDIEAGKLQSQAEDQADSKESSPSMPGYYGYVAMKLAEFILPAEKQSNTTAVQNEDKEDWGQAVEGAQVRLLDAAQIWGRSDWPHTVVRLRLDARNEGARYLHLPENGLSWQIEVDGVWYEWVDPQRHIAPEDRDQTASSRGGRLLDFNPGDAHAKLTVDIASDWRQIPDGKQDEYGRRRWTGWAGIDDEYGPELILQPGPHRLRVAITCPPSRAGSNGPVRLLSNPVKFGPLPQSDSAAEDEPAEGPKQTANRAGSVHVLPAGDDGGEDKAQVLVDCRVLEIYPSMKFDRETIIAAENLLGETPTVRVGRDGAPTHPGRASRMSASKFEDWIRELAGATVLGEEPSIMTADGKTTRKMVDLLVSRGYMKILLAPTIEVVDGGTGRVQSTQRVPIGKATGSSTQSDHYEDVTDYFEITPHIVDDDRIKLLTEGTINRQLSRQDKGQPPIVTKSSFSTQVVVDPGTSLIMGGAEHTDDRAEASERPQTKVIFIITPTIAQTGKPHDETGVVSTAKTKTPPRNMVTRVYDVTDLLGEPADHGGMSRVMQVQNLVTLIQERVAPESWYDLGMGGEGTITPYPREEPKKLAVYNVATVHREIERLLDNIRSGVEKLNELNINKTHILIETQILTVTDDFLKSIELDANSVRTSEMWSEHLLADSPAEPNSQPYLLILNDLNVNLLLKATAAPQGKGGRVLAAPQVMAADGRQVIMKIVREEYHFLSPSDPNDPSGKTESKPERIEVGTSIRLTPDALPDNENVRLDFEWELRQIRGFEQRVGPDGKKQKFPLIAVDSIKTIAVVPDAKTLLIGGKKICRQLVTRTKKPLLGDLPLIGGFFRSVSKIKDTQNVLILVKPTINPKKTSPPTPLPLGPNDPLLKKLREKFERSATPT